MKYTYCFFRALRRIRRNIPISVLMIAQIAIGISAFIYSSNLFFSMKTETESRKSQSRDLCLEISVDNNEIDAAIPLTLNDCYKIQEMSNNTAFICMDTLQFVPHDDTFYEFHLSLVDYSPLGLSNDRAYYGHNICLPEDVLRKVIPPKITLDAMSEAIESIAINTGEKDVAFSECIMIPLAYMDDYCGEIVPAGIHVEWSSASLADKENAIRDIESYLNLTLNKKFHYRIISPEIELDSYRFKTDRAIRTIESGSILFICMYCIGQLSVFQILFERRKKSYGVCLAVGAEKSQLALELGIEVIVINAAGLLIGSIIGTIATARLNLGIMPGDIPTKICPESFSLELGLAFATVSITIASMCARLNRDHELKMIRD